MTWKQEVYEYQQAIFEDFWFLWLPLVLYVFFVAGCLVDKKGKILIPGINDAVAPLTDEECKLYDQIDFDMEEYAKDVGATRLLHATKV